MRRFFASLVHAEMQRAGSIAVVTTDLGHGIWDAVRSDYPDRFFNVGAAEQAAAGVGIGLALAGKLPIVYSITPFLLCRPFELWRLYVGRELIPVKLVGSGRAREYLRDGPTHWADDDATILSMWPGVEAFWPTDEADLHEIFHGFLWSRKPAYLNLRRS